MAINTRNCFWFGTEERADWFATPLAGADSSPSAWGADGTLLNGGGWALNSWGSHKRYTYEWPASSSRETAQRMKSYRDGTYGRGLLYFLEPTIFTTNVLPAHWADPSMSLDNEAPSLVYGVDPTPVATSGGANLGLPITSAQYDLTGTPLQAIPTPDSSVFIPIPTGHTLVLGAFYSATGGVGVFATPVNGNGTLGDAVRLTAKQNSDTSVVGDQFSGDLRGVRLWVGRRTEIVGETPTITLSAMSGRLMETSDLPVYGPWVEGRRNLFNPGALTSGMGIAVGSGSISNVSGAVGFYFPVTPGVAYSIRRPSPLSPRFRWTFTSAPPVGGATSLGGDFNGSYDAVDLVNGIVAPPGAGYMFLYLSNVAGPVSPLLIEEAPTAGSYFDGNTPAPDDTTQYIWVGVENNSESVMNTRTRSGSTSKLDKLASGPWIGGQGHSGCRFLGTPSYVTNSPIEGGRIGFAASFVEVGSWIYG